MPAASKMGSRSERLGADTWPFLQGKHRVEICLQDGVGRRDTGEHLYLPQGSLCCYSTATQMIEQHWFCCNAGIWQHFPPGRLRRMPTCEAAVPAGWGSSLVSAASTRKWRGQPTGDKRQSKHCCKISVVVTLRTNLRCQRS